MFFFPADIWFDLFKSSVSRFESGTKQMETVWVGAQGFEQRHYKNLTVKSSCSQTERPLSGTKWKTNSRCSRFHCFGGRDVLCFRVDCQQWSVRRSSKLLTNREDSQKVNRLHNVLSSTSFSFAFERINIHKLVYSLLPPDVYNEPGLCQPIYLMYLSVSERS